MKMQMNAPMKCQKSAEHMCDERCVCVGVALDLQLQWHSRQVLIADTIYLAINCNICYIHT